MKIYLIKKKSTSSFNSPTLTCNECRIYNIISLNNIGLCIACFNQIFQKDVHLINKNMIFLCVQNYSISNDLKNLIEQKKDDINHDLYHNNNNEKLSLKYIWLLMYSIFMFIMLFISIFIYDDDVGNNFSISYYIFCTLFSFFIISLFIYEIIKNNENLHFVEKLTKYKYTDQLKNILITNIFIILSIIIQLIKINNYNNNKEKSYLSIQYELIILIQFWFNIQLTSIIYNLKKKRLFQSSKIKKLINQNLRI